MWNSERNIHNCSPKCLWTGWSQLRRMSTASVPTANMTLTLVEVEVKVETGTAVEIEKEAQVVVVIEREVITETVEVVKKEVMEAIEVEISNMRMISRMERSPVKLVRIIQHFH